MITSPDRCTHSYTVRLPCLRISARSLARSSFWKRSAGLMEKTCARTRVKYQRGTVAERTGSPGHGAAGLTRGRLHTALRALRRLRSTPTDRVSARHDEPFLLAVHHCVPSRAVHMERRPRPSAPEVELCERFWLVAGLADPFQARRAICLSEDASAAHARA